MADSYPEQPCPINLVLQGKIFLLQDLYTHINDLPKVKLQLKHKGKTLTHCGIKWVMISPSAGSTQHCTTGYHGPVHKVEQKRRALKVAKWRALYFMIDGLRT